MKNQLRHQYNYSLCLVSILHVILLLVSHVQPFSHHDLHHAKHRTVKSVQRSERVFKNDRTSHDVIRKDTDKNNSSKRTTLYAEHSLENSPFDHSTLQKRDKWLDNTRNSFTDDKFPVTDSEMDILKGSDLLEQKRQKSALKADTSFERDALASLDADERKIMEDEQKVNEDRKRKFGKHRKHEGRNNEANSRTIKDLKAEIKANGDDDTDEDDKVDIYTKIKEFAEALNPPKHRTLHSKHHKTSKREIENAADGEVREIEDNTGNKIQDITDDSHSLYRDKRDIEENEELRLDDNILKSYASDESDNSYVAERSQTPSQILGNIAKIFEEVNDKNNEEVIDDNSGDRRRKDTIPVQSVVKDPIPRPYHQEETRRVKDVIPRPTDEDEHPLEKYDKLERRTHRAKIADVENIDPILDDPSHLNREYQDVEALVDDILQSTNTRRRKRHLKVDRLSLIPIETADFVDANEDDDDWIAGSAEITAGDPEYVFQDEASGDFDSGESDDGVRSKDKSTAKSNTRKKHKSKNSSTKNSTADLHYEIKPHNSSTHNETTITENYVVDASNGDDSSTRETSVVNSNKTVPVNNSTITNTSIGHGDQDEGYLSPTATLNATKNSTVAMTKYIDTILKTPTLRDRYLYQLSHQGTAGAFTQRALNKRKVTEPNVGMVGNAEEVEKLQVSGSSRGSIQGESDDKRNDIVWKPFEEDCSSASGSESGSESGSGSKSGSGSGESGSGASGSGSRCRLVPVQDENLLPPQSLSQQQPQPPPNQSPEQPNKTQPQQKPSKSPQPQTPQQHTSSSPEEPPQPNNPQGQQPDDQQPDQQKPNQQKQTPQQPQPKKGRKPSSPKKPSDFNTSDRKTRFKERREQPQPQNGDPGMVLEYDKETGAWVASITKLSKNSLNKPDIQKTDKTNTANNSQEKSKLAKSKQSKIGLHISYNEGDKSWSAVSPHKIGGFDVLPGVTGMSPVKESNKTRKYQRVKATQDKVKEPVSKGKVEEKPKEGLHITYNEDDATWSAVVPHKVNSTAEVLPSVNTTKKFQKTQSNAVISNRKIQQWNKPPKGMKIKYNDKEDTWNAVNLQQKVSGSTDKEPVDKNNTKKADTNTEPLPSQGMLLLQDHKTGQWLAAKVQSVNEQPESGRISPLKNINHPTDVLPKRRGSSKKNKTISVETNNARVGSNIKKENTNTASQPSHGMLVIQDPKTGKWIAAEVKSQNQQTDKGSKILPPKNISQPTDMLPKRTSNKKSKDSDHKKVMMPVFEDGSWSAKEFDKLTENHRDSKNETGLAKDKTTKKFLHGNESNVLKSSVQNYETAEGVQRFKRDMVFFLVNEKDSDSPRKTAGTKKNIKRKSSKDKSHSSHPPKNLGKIGKAKSRRKRIKMIMTRKRKFVPISSESIEHDDASVLGNSENESESGEDQKNDDDESSKDDGSGSGSNENEEEDYQSNNKRSVISAIPENSYYPALEDPTSNIVDYSNEYPEHGVIDINSQHYKPQPSGMKKSNFQLHMKSYYPKKMILESLRKIEHLKAGKRAKILRSKNKNIFNSNQTKEQIKTPTKKQLKHVKRNRKTKQPTRKTTKTTKKRRKTATKPVTKIKINHNYKESRKQKQQQQHRKSTTKNIATNKRNEITREENIENEDDEDDDFDDDSDDNGNADYPDDDYDDEDDDEDEEDEPDEQTAQLNNNRKATAENHYAAISSAGEQKHNIPVNHLLTNTTTCCQLYFNNPKSKLNCCSRERSEIENDVNCCYGNKRKKITWGGFENEAPAPWLSGNVANMTSLDSGQVSPPITSSPDGSMRLNDLLHQLSNRDTTKATNKTSTEASSSDGGSVTKTTLPHPTKKPEGKQADKNDSKNKNNGPMYIEFPITPGKGVSIPASSSNDKNNKDKSIKIVWGSVNSDKTTPTPPRSSSDKNSSDGKTKDNGKDSSEDDGYIIINKDRNKKTPTTKNNKESSGNQQDSNQSNKDSKKRPKPSEEQKLTPTSSSASGNQLQNPTKSKNKPTSTGGTTQSGSTTNGPVPSKQKEDEEDDEQENETDNQNSDGASNKEIKRKSKKKGKGQKIKITIDVAETSSKGNNTIKAPIGSTSNKASKTTPTSNQKSPTTGSKSNNSTTSSSSSSPVPTNQNAKTESRKTKPTKGKKEQDFSKLLTTSTTPKPTTKTSTTKITVPKTSTPTTTTTTTPKTTTTTSKDETEEEEDTSDDIIVTSIFPTSSTKSNPKSPSTFTEPSTSKKPTKVQKHKTGSTSKKPSTTKQQQQGSGGKTNKTVTPAPATVTFTKTSFKILCLPYQWPCTQFTPLPTSQPQLYPSSNDSLIPLESTVRPKVTTEQIVGEVLTPPPVATLIPVNFPKEGKKPVVIAQPVIPLVPVPPPISPCITNPCEPQPQTPCVPSPGFPCPLADIQVIEPSSTNINNPPAGKVNVWAIETVHTTVQNDSSSSISSPSKTQASTSNLSTSKTEKTVYTSKQTSAQSSATYKLPIGKYGSATQSERLTAAERVKEPAIVGKTPTPSVQETVESTSSYNEPIPNAISVEEMNVSTQPYQRANTSTTDRLSSPVQDMLLKDKGATTPSTEVTQPNTTPSTEVTQPNTTVTPKTTPDLVQAQWKQYYQQFESTSTTPTPAFNPFLPTDTTTTTAQPGARSKETEKETNNGAAMNSTETHTEEAAEEVSSEEEGDTLKQLPATTTTAIPTFNPYLPVKMPSTPVPGTPSTTVDTSPPAYNPYLPQNDTYVQNLYPTETTQLPYYWPTESTPPVLPPQHTREEKEKDDENDNDKDEGSSGNDEPKPNKPQQPQPENPYAAYLDYYDDYYSTTTTSPTTSPTTTTAPVTSETPYYPEITPVPTTTTTTTTTEEPYALQEQESNTDSNGYPVTTTQQPTLSTTSSSTLYLDMLTTPKAVPPALIETPSPDITPANPWPVYGTVTPAVNDKQPNDTALKIILGNTLQSEAKKDKEDKKARKQRGKQKQVFLQNDNEEDENNSEDEALERGEVFNVDMDNPPTTTTTTTAAPEQLHENHHPDEHIEDERNDQNMNTQWMNDLLALPPAFMNHNSNATQVVQNLQGQEKAKMGEITTTATPSRNIKTMNHGENVPTGSRLSSTPSTIRKTTKTKEYADTEVVNTETSLSLTKASTTPVKPFSTKLKYAVTKETSTPTPGTSTPERYVSDEDDHPILFTTSIKVSTKHGKSTSASATITTTPVTQVFNVQTTTSTTTTPLVENVGYMGFPDYNSFLQDYYSKLNNPIASSSQSNVTNNNVNSELLNEKEPIDFNHNDSNGLQQHTGVKEKSSESSDINPTDTEKPASPISSTLTKARYSDDSSTGSGDSLLSLPTDTTTMPPSKTESPTDKDGNENVQPKDNGYMGFPDYTSFLNDFYDKLTNTVNQGTKNSKENPTESSNTQSISVSAIEKESSTAPISSKEKATSQNPSKQWTPQQWPETQPGKPQQQQQQSSYNPRYNPYLPTTSQPPTTTTTSTTPEIPSMKSNDQDTDDGREDTPIADSQGLFSENGTHVSDKNFKPVTTPGPTTSITTTSEPILATVNVNEILDTTLPPAPTVVTKPFTPKYPTINPLATPRQSAASNNPYNYQENNIQSGYQATTSSPTTASLTDSEIFPNTYSATTSDGKSKQEFKEVKTESVTTPSVSTTSGTYQQQSEFKLPTTLNVERKIRPSESSDSSYQESNEESKLDGNVWGYDSYADYLDAYYKKINDFYNNLQQQQATTTGLPALTGGLPSGKVDKFIPPGKVKDENNEQQNALPELVARDEENIPFDLVITTTEQPATEESGRSSRGGSTTPSFTHTAKDTTNGKPSATTYTTPRTTTSEKNEPTTNKDPFKAATVTTENSKTPTINKDNDQTTSATSKPTSTTSTTDASDTDINPTPIPVVTMEIEIVPKTEDEYEASIVGTTTPVSLREDSTSTTTTTTTTATPTTTTSQTTTESTNGKSESEANGSGIEPILINVPYKESSTTSSQITSTTSKPISTQSQATFQYNQPAEENKNNLDTQITSISTDMASDTANKATVTNPIPTTPAGRPVMGLHIEDLPRNEGNSQGNSGVIENESSPITTTKTPTPVGNSNDAVLIETKPYEQSDDTSSTTEQPPLKTNIGTDVIADIMSRSEGIDEAPPSPTPTTPSGTTTPWPYNDLNYDYRLMWAQYSQELQTWVNKYMVPIEHHKIRVHPDNHPTISPDSNGYQSEYESYLNSIDNWEAKYRPYAKTSTDSSVTPTPSISSAEKTTTEEPTKQTESATAPSFQSEKNTKLLNELDYKITDDMAKVTESPLVTSNDNSAMSTSSSDVTGSKFKGLTEGPTSPSKLTSSNPTGETSTPTITITMPTPSDIPIEGKPDDVQISSPWEQVITIPTLTTPSVIPVEGKPDEPISPPGQQVITMPTLTTKTVMIPSVMNVQSSVENPPPYPVVDPSQIYQPAYVLPTAETTIVSSTVEPSTEPTATTAVPISTTPQPISIADDEAVTPVPVLFTNPASAPPPNIILIPASAVQEENERLNEQADEYPNINYTSHNFNLWDQANPQYPEFSHNVISEQAITEKSDDSDEDILPDGVKTTTSTPIPDTTPTTTTLEPATTSETTTLEATAPTTTTLEPATASETTTLEPTTTATTTTVEPVTVPNTEPPTDTTKTIPSEAIIGTEVSSTSELTTTTPMPPGEQQSPSSSLLSKLVPTVLEESQDSQSSEIAPLKPVPDTSTDSSTDTKKLPNLSDVENSIQGPSAAGHIFKTTLSNSRTKISSTSNTNGNLNPDIVSGNTEPEPSTVTNSALPQSPTEGLATNVVQEKASEQPLVSEVTDDIDNSALNTSDNTPADSSGAESFSQTSPKDANALYDPNFSYQTSNTETSFPSKRMSLTKLLLPQTTNNKFQTQQNTTNSIVSNPSPSNYINSQYYSGYPVSQVGGDQSLIAANNGYDHQQYARTNVVSEKANVEQEPTGYQTQYKRDNIAESIPIIKKEESNEPRSSYFTPPSHSEYRAPITARSIIERPEPNYNEDRAGTKMNFMNYPVWDDNIDWGNELIPEDFNSRSNEMIDARDNIPRREPVNIDQKLKEPYINFIKKSYFPRLDNTMDSFNGRDLEVLPDDDELVYKKKK